MPACRWQLYQTDAKLQVAAGAMSCCLGRTSATTAWKAEGKFLGKVSPQMAEVFLNRNTKAEDGTELGLYHSLVWGLGQAP